MKKQIIFLLFICMVCLSLLAGCSTSRENTAGNDAANDTTTITQDGEDQALTHNLFAMDTFMTLTAYGPFAQSALDKAEAEIMRLDDLLSTGKSDSEIGRLNQEGHAVLSETSVYLLTRSLEVHAMTGGAFNPFVYPLMEAWGFPDESYQVPEQKRIEELLLLTDMDHITFNSDTGEVSFAEEGMKLDFGGIAKGYTSARVIDILRGEGVCSAVISLGGNVQTLGKKPDGTLWKVAIRDPDNLSGFLGVLSTSDMAVITSGGYERFFEQDGIIYHHILDPETGYPAQNGLLSVTIISEDATLADALSTSLYVTGLEVASAIWQGNADRFDAIFMTDNQELYITEGIRDVFTSSYQVHVIERGEVS